ncbi:MAG: VWA domain-containing protein [Euryarchaeota archaeon]|nr:VWA domain-containing protein [Euryarchaeota archaeon]
MEFGAPERLYLLLLIPAYVLFYWYALRMKRAHVLRFANLSMLRRVAEGKPVYENYLPLALRLIAFALLVVALAEPVSVVKVKSTGSDIVLAIDVSESMSATDLKPSRIEAAKSSAIVFAAQIGGGDRVGVVSFAGAPHVVVPLTSDLDEVIDGIRGIGLGKEPGTALGDAIMSAVSMVSGSERRRVVVLLSDGVSNRGVSPGEAVEYAKKMGVRIFTVGIGTPSGIIPTTGSRAELDETTLRSIAAATGGEYRYARSEAELRDIYSEIARTISEQEVRKPLTTGFVAGALLLLLLEFSLAATKYRTLP